MVKFTWDEKKNRTNLKKHGVDFNDAVRAWYDPDRLDFFDMEHSSDEVRWIFLGAVAGAVLFVVETEPDEETVRIISARRASKYEQEAYYVNRRKNS
jgi:uncharacterized DUF497 family protein